jgi:hypothetical protein
MRRSFDLGQAPFDNGCLFEKLGGMKFWRVGEPKFFPSPFGFCPFRARVIGGNFSQGVALCYGLVAPLGRKKIRRNVRQSIPFVA